MKRLVWVIGTVCTFGVTMTLAFTLLYSSAPRMQSIAGARTTEENPRDERAHLLEDRGTLLSDESEAESFPSDRAYLSGIVFDPIHPEESVAIFNTVDNGSADSTFIRVGDSIFGGWIVDSIQARSVRVKRGDNMDLVRVGEGESSLVQQGDSTLEQYALRTDEYRTLKQAIKSQLTGLNHSQSSSFTEALLNATGPLAASIGLDTSVQIIEINGALTMQLSDAGFPVDSVLAGSSLRFRVSRDGESATIVVEDSLY